MIIVIIAITIIAILIILNKLKQQKIVNTFKQGSVLVGGTRGSGKDMLFNYVISKRKQSYISNVQYAEYEKAMKAKPKDQKWIEFKPQEQWSVGGNTNTDFIEGKVKRYEYPYSDKIDYYISDVGIYFPAQEVTQLNRRYKSATVFQALARHLGDCNIHANTQAFNRVWDKLREQFETYILCRKCKVFFGKIVRQKVTIYDRYESAVNKVQPIRRGIMPKARREYEAYRAMYGEIKNITITYVMKRKYDTRRFKALLKGGKNEEVERQNEERAC